MDACALMNLPFFWSLLYIARELHVNGIEKCTQLNEIGVIFHNLHRVATKTANLMKFPNPSTSWTDFSVPFTPPIVSSTPRLVLCWHAKARQTESWPEIEKESTIQCQPIIHNDKFLWHQREPSTRQTLKLRQTMTMITAC